MAAVYMNAHLTLVVASGRDVGSGIPGISYARPLLQSASVNGFELGCVPDQPVIGRKGLGIHTKWSDRGWTLQEHLLSHRCLVFLEHQTYWSCRMDQWLETMNLDDADVEFLSSQETEESDIWSGPRGFFQMELDEYFDLVNDYMRRELTMEGDIANAFEGIASLMGHNLWWGTPIVHFERFLLELSLPLADLVRRDFQGPSWSWMAWKRVEGRSELSIEDKIRTVCCYRLDCGVLRAVCEDSTGLGTTTKHSHYDECPPTLEVVPSGIIVDPAMHLVFWAQCTGRVTGLSRGRDGHFQVAVPSCLTEDVVFMRVSGLPSVWTRFPFGNVHYKIAIIGTDENGPWAMLLSWRNEIAQREWVFRILDDLEEEGVQLTRRLIVLS